MVAWLGECGVDQRIRDKADLITHEAMNALHEFLPDPGKSAPFVELADQLLARNR
jgi:hypothetical protein